MAVVRRLREPLDIVDCRPSLMAAAAMLGAPVSDAAQLSDLATIAYPAESHHALCNLCGRLDHAGWDARREWLAGELAYVILAHLERLTGLPRSRRIGRPARVTAGELAHGAADELARVAPPWNA